LSASLKFQDASDPYTAADDAPEKVIIVPSMLVDWFSKAQASDIIKIRPSPANPFIAVGFPLLHLLAWNPPSANAVASNAREVPVPYEKENSKAKITLNIKYLLLLIEFS
jgi:hypothetical protein